MLETQCHMLSAMDDGAPNVLVSLKFDRAYAAQGAKTVMRGCDAGDMTGRHPVDLEGWCAAETLVGSSGAKKPGRHLARDGPIECLPLRVVYQRCPFETSSVGLESRSRSTG